MTRRTCRLALGFLVATAVGASLASSANAQGMSREAKPMALEDVQRLTDAGQFEAAGQAYKAIITQQFEAGVSPAAALRGLATVEFLQDNKFRAAAALDELASRAAEFGDPATQIGALLDAALLYQEMGRRSEVAQRAVRIRRLLQSPALPSAVRDDVRSRLVER